MKYATIAATVATAMTLSTAALAQSAGDFTVGVGLGMVEPKSDNGSLANGTLDVEVGSNVQPTLTFEYFIMDNLGIEVLAATPFEHDIKINGAGKVGSTRHLPPTISLKYHFQNDSAITPFLGAGINYTRFFTEKTTGVLTGTQLNLSDSFGLALSAGLDYAISDKGALRTEVRWMDIDTDVRVNGAKLGTTKIDPVVVGISYVHNF